MNNVLITGASGMIGGLILNQCLESTSVRSITSFVRKESGRTHNKLKEVVVSDFNDFRAYQDYFRDIHSVYFCIGAYTGQVPDDMFKKITVDFLKSFVDTLRSHSPQATFCFLSGQGADRTEKSNVSFAKYKGMAENLLFETLENAYSFQPAYIYPVQKRKEPNLAYRIFRVLYPIAKLFGKKYSIKSTELASVMLNVGLEGAEKKILENADILSLAQNQ